VSVSIGRVCHLGHYRGDAAKARWRQPGRPRGRTGDRL